jgi:hypothetical protein
MQSLRKFALRFGMLLCLLCLSATLVANAHLPAKDDVFRTVIRQQGDDKVHTYRIPGWLMATALLQFSSHLY